ncbi:MAG TPA: hypothetical protein PKE63_02345 [Lacibacter sp.]|nr:hypothetical protein [Lacibacter sp.]HMO90170.1 hypothetical protein [Lacibacter sp.]HMP86085.1 hypothetical protein [Lacibacter sp.]
MRILLFLFLLAGPGGLAAQQTNTNGALGLPGDNLNLYAALKLFQECKTLEEFEQKLNDEEQKINNLDLDGNNETDYIHVSDQVKDGVHNITLEIALSENEKQAVAVFIVSKTGEEEVQIQVVGDEDLYGKDYIIEPNYEEAGGTPNPGYTGNNTAREEGETYELRSTSFREVYQWPIIRFIYVPAYRPWLSPWYRGYYPSWWRPWRPYWWHWYYGYHYHWNYWYYGYYRRWGWYRYQHWHSWYYGPGSWRQRSGTYHARYKAGDYRKTYSRPESVTDGSAAFKTRFPTAPTAAKLPPPAKVPTFEPSLVKPVSRPAPTGQPSKPGVTKPAVNRPATKPTVTRPQPAKPVTRPSSKPATKPATRPTGTRPATRPVSKPVTPAKNGNN